MKLVCLEGKEKDLMAAWRWEKTHGFYIWNIQTIPNFTLLTPTCASHIPFCIILRCTFGATYQSHPWDWNVTKNEKVFWFSWNRKTYLRRIHAVERNTAQAGWNWTKGNRLLRLCESGLQKRVHYRLAPYHERAGEARRAHKKGCTSSWGPGFLQASHVSTSRRDLFERKWVCPCFQKQGCYNLENRLILLGRILLDRPPPFSQIRQPKNLRLVKFK